MRPNVPKPLHWLGSSKKDLDGFPELVQKEFGFALYRAELGSKHPDAKPLRGFHGASVLEMVDDYDGDTYRAVYTVRFEEAIYVLHCFQKKSRHGISTPRTDLDLIQRRLREAEAKHAEWKKKK